MAGSKFSDGSENICGNLRASLGRDSHPNITGACRGSPPKDGEKTGQAYSEDPENKPLNFSQMSRENEGHQVHWR